MELIKFYTEKLKELNIKKKMTEDEMMITIEKIKYNKYFCRACSTRLNNLMIELQDIEEKRYELNEILSKFIR